MHSTMQLGSSKRSNRTSMRAPFELMATTTRSSMPSYVASFARTASISTIARRVTYGRSCAGRRPMTTDTKDFIEDVACAVILGALVMLCAAVMS